MPKIERASLTSQFCNANVSELHHFNDGVVAAARHPVDRLTAECKESGLRKLIVQNHLRRC